VLRNAYLTAIPFITVSYFNEDQKLDKKSLGVYCLLMWAMQQKTLSLPYEIWLE